MKRVCALRRNATACPTSVCMTIFGRLCTSMLRMRLTRKAHAPRCWRLRRRQACAWSCSPTWRAERKRGAAGATAFFSLPVKKTEARACFGFLRQIRLRRKAAKAAAFAFFPTSRSGSTRARMVWWGWRSAIGTPTPSWTNRLKSTCGVPPLTPHCGAAWWTKFHVYPDELFGAGTDYHDRIFAKWDAELDHKPFTGIGAERRPPEPDLPGHHLRSV